MSTAGEIHSGARSAASSRLASRGGTRPILADAVYALIAGSVLRTAAAGNQAPRRILAE